MNRVSGAFALVILAAASLAAAQTQSAPRAGTMPPTPYPSSTAPAPAASDQTTNGDTSSESRSAKKQQIKDCIAQQKAGNSGMSKHEMKKYCKNQVENSSHE